MKKIILTLFVLVVIAGLHGAGAVHWCWKNRDTAETRRAARKAAAASVEESRNPALGEKARRRAEEDAEKNVEIARNAERDFVEKRQERQRSLNEQELRMLRLTVRQIEEQVSKYAKAKGLTVVLPTSGTRLGIAPAAVWADESTDITEDIMALLGIEDKAGEEEPAGEPASDAPKGE